MPAAVVHATSIASRADRLRRAGLPRWVDVAVAGNGRRFAEDAVVARLAERRLDLVLCEGGPTLFGGLVGAGLIDELFLTIAPQVAGRDRDTPRLGLVEGLAFEVGAAPWAELRAVLRTGSHLFLRYGLAGASRHAGGST